MSYCNSDYCPGCGKYLDCDCDEMEMTEEELIANKQSEQENRYYEEMEG